MNRHTITLIRYKRMHGITGRTRRLYGYVTHQLQAWTYRVISGPMMGREFTVEQKKD